MPCAKRGESAFRRCRRLHNQNSLPFAFTACDAPQRGAAAQMSHMQHTSCAELAARLIMLRQVAKCLADLRWLSLLLDTDNIWNSATWGQHDTSDRTNAAWPGLAASESGLLQQIGCKVTEQADPAIVTCSGAAKSDEEAERVCEALKNAGIVLRVGDMVYLKPEEVVEIILRVSFPSSLTPTGALCGLFSPGHPARYAPPRCAETPSKPVATRAHPSCRCLGAFPGMHSLSIFCTIATQCTAGGILATTGCQLCAILTDVQRLCICCRVNVFMHAGNQTVQAVLDAKGRQHNR